jgi:hypothetical protein
MPTVHVTTHSRLSTEQLLAAAYDFSARRAEIFPAVSTKYFWELRATPTDDGSTVEMIWEREFEPGSRGRIFGTLFRLVGKPISHMRPSASSGTSSDWNRTALRRRSRRPRADTSDSTPGPAFGVLHESRPRNQQSRNARHPGRGRPDDGAADDVERCSDAQDPAGRQRG